MLSRREFLKLCSSAVLTASLTEQLLPIMRQVYAENKVDKPPVIWLELGSCTGNSISMDNAVNPTLDQILVNMIDLRYDWSLNVAQGPEIVQTLLNTADKEAGKFWLVIEGSVMTADNGRYNHVFMRGDQMVTGMATLRNLLPRLSMLLLWAPAPVSAVRGRPTLIREEAEGYGR